MKTAMQEFIEYLEKSYYITKYTNFDKDKIQFLEKEKEQLEEARLKGYGEGYNEGVIWGRI
jgi:flagellar biosynthesis/type III secretory pathway protein FliH